MKLETERLYIVPCTEESIQVANEQGYNSGRAYCRACRECETR